MIELLNGRLVETEEERQARLDVLDWWKHDCGWGKSLNPEPVKSDEPGPLDTQELPVTPGEASLGPSYRGPEIRKCLDCHAPITLGKRCAACGRKDKLMRERDRKARVRAAGTSPELMKALAILMKDTPKEPAEGSIAPW